MSNIYGITTSTLWMYMYQLDFLKGNPVQMESIALGS